MDAILLSMEEVQLDKCLRALKDQTDPLNHIIHIAGVVPESAAFNQGLARVDDDWFIVVAGDMVLYPDAVSKMKRRMNQLSGIAACAFSLYDTFLKDKVIGCVLYRIEAMRKIVWRNTLRNDAAAMFELRRAGWGTRRKSNVTVGTHFDDPNRFQIFSRFFARGAKRVYAESYLVKLQSLYDSSGDDGYKLAIDALRFGMSNPYTGSRNMRYDMEMFRKFKKERANA